MFKTPDFRHGHISVFVPNHSNYVFECFRYAACAMAQRRRWADITDEEVDTLWAAAPCAAALPPAAAPRRPRRRPPRAARQHARMTGAIYGNLLRLHVGPGEPRCGFAAKSASVFAVAAFAQLCSALLGLGVGFLLEPRLEDVLRPEARESDLGWKLYRLLGNATCVCRS